MAYRTSSVSRFYDAKLDNSEYGILYSEYRVNKSNLVMATEHSGIQRDWRVKIIPMSVFIVALCIIWQCWEYDISPT